MTALAIGAVLFAFVAGNSARTRVEHPIARATMDGLLASTDKELEIGEVDYFREMARLLEKEFVDPIADERKLANGAVRGMVASLGDPQSVFMDKDLFRAYKNAQEGKFEGIGVWLALTSEDGWRAKQKRTTAEVKTSDSVSADGDEESASIDSSVKMPVVTVAMVVPGGPADKAGVKSGDRVAYVGDRWSICASEISAFRRIQSAMISKPASAGDMYRQAHRALRLRFERRIMPMRVMSRLLLGESESVDLVLERGRQAESAAQGDLALLTRPTDRAPFYRVKLTKQATSVPSFAMEGETLSGLSFTGDAASRLRDIVASRKSLTIDLRNNVIGDFETMRECLAAVAPASEYGLVNDDRKRKPRILRVSEGRPGLALNLIVDATTRGPAEVFALALKSKGVARILGPGTGGDRRVIETQPVDDGGGYTLVVGKYSMSAPVARTAKAVSK